MVRNVEVAQAFYDAHAAQYARLVDPTLAGAVERLVQLAGARRCMRLLDLATGTGAAARAAVSRGASVVAVDLSPGMLVVAREVSPEIDFRLSAARVLPFEANAFDAVTCGLSVSHFGEPDTVLREVLRVLREEGRFVASAWGEGGSTPSARMIAEILDRHGGGESGYRLDEETWFHPESGSEALRRAGFESVSVTTELFTGTFADADEALRWALAWPVWGVRLARLEEGAVDSFMDVAREAIAASDLSWRFALNFYVASR